MVNFQDVDNLLTAQTRQWSFLENLKTRVNRPSVIYSNGKLLIVGATNTKETCSSVQFLDLASNKTGVFDGSVDCGLDSGYQSGPSTRLKQFA